MKCGRMITLVACFVVCGISSAEASALRVHLGFVLDDGSMTTVAEIDEAVSTVSGAHGNENVTLTHHVIRIKDGHFTEAELCAAASTGITTVVSLTQCKRIHAVKSTFNAFQIPVINVGPDPCHVREGCFFSNVEFEKSNMAEFVRDVVVKDNWTNVNILYDSTFSSEVLDEIQTLLHSKVISTTLVNLDLVSDLETTLKKIYNSWEKIYWNYMIAANDEKTLDVLDKALTLSMRDKGKTWVILNPAVTYDSIESRLKVLDNIGLVRQVAREESWLCEPTETALENLIETIVEGHDDANSAGMLVNQTVEKCKGEWQSGRDLMTFTRARMRVKGENCTRYTQYELRSTFLVGTKMKLGRTAKWNRRDGLQLDSDVLFPNSRNGFNGMNFRVTTLPYSYFQQNKSFPDGSFAMVGLVPDIVNILARSLNFTVTWVQPPDGYWGAPESDGSWNGMIGQVMRGEADFAAAGHSVTAARSEVVDFADAFFYEASIIMVKTPGSLGRLLVYLAPLSTMVWICTLIAIPVCAIFLWLLMRVSPFYSNQDPTFYPESLKLLEFGPCLWYIFGCLWTQGQSTTPRAMSGRLLLTSWWLLVVVILATYSGNLIAFLTVTKVTLPISTLSELADQNDMAYGTIKGTSLWTLLETSKAGAPQRIWNTMDKQDQPDSYLAGKEKVFADNYALLVEKSFFDGVAADNCSFTHVPKEEFFFSSYGIAVGKGSPLTVILSEGIQAMSESGVLEKLCKDWTPRQRCEGLTYSVSKPASLEDTQGAFIVLGIGLAAGSVALVVEVFLKRVLREIKRKALTTTRLESETSIESNNNVKVKGGRRRSSI